MRETYEFLFVKGGLVMYPIVLGSVLALAIFLERMWATRRDKVIPEALLAEVEALVRAGKRTDAALVCRSSETSLGRVLAVGLERVGRSREEIREAVEVAGRREVASLERFTGALGTLAMLEPLLGLLGTVTGLIAAFKTVERLQVVGNPAAIAAGVWEALITTAAGLIIAIPALAGYRYLLSRVDALILELEERAFFLLAEAGVSAGADLAGMTHGAPAAVPSPGVGS